jgi:hypothetical protein
MSDRNHIQIRADEALVKRITDVLSKASAEELSKIAGEAGVSFWTVRELAMGRQHSTRYETAFRLASTLFAELRVRPRRTTGAADGGLKRKLASAKAALQLIADGDMEYAEIIRIAREAGARIDG